ncbi:hypothetical protein PUN28_007585 [Cardiocondyla obscurior]|uniref:Uncharacterized protein n=1 Tax=Cardiocondyla obscurior TaxID=286306 RepID=A0AAW2G6F6_9HYME
MLCNVAIGWASLSISGVNVSYDFSEMTSCMDSMCLSNLVNSKFGIIGSVDISNSPRKAASVSTLRCRRCRHRQTEPRCRLYLSRVSIGTECSLGRRWRKPACCLSRGRLGKLLAKVQIPRNLNY